ncbi:MULTISPECIES: DUF4288 domain-containing protein [Bacillus]|jgi:hypothetical protein|uniref:DUF4288 domain-containing protein n=1 Tax=Bacillus pumilus TaxID=1408 RepID=A0AAE4B9P0_BACPU|nr:MULTISPECIES: DUF4288 domain-containing protein [Bacillus]AOC57891.1 hypothetical protein BEN31_14300 [Bacillus pumilus]AZV54572.1 DUF4288 domain-containing protein [Bacillus pumilus]MBR0588013.1 DUF4288 domain-containing protein [Bacillus pumilus DW2J2]MBR0618076.1 DUF4288 domain-containing protein [Bacillus pumilus]MBR0621946.1 DUF4288 domain-containing protein [Bacillus pumilus]
MYDLFSAKLLFESIPSPKVRPDKIFEERIVLIKAKDQDEVKKIIEKSFPEETFGNGDYGQTTKKLVAILDIFELVDNLEEEPLHLSEVYCRYLSFDEEISPKEAIEKYSLDK